jgi:hypothetical protein
MAQFELTNPVWQWWLTLSLISAVNIALWFVIRRATRRAPASPAEGDQRLRLLMVAFAGVYVFVCAFRSVVPRADVQRISLFDSWVASVLVGRAAATAAELSFVAQWSLALRRTASIAGARAAGLVASIAVPVIALAECFSWYAVISTNYLGNVIEESIWAGTGLLGTVAAALLLPRYRGTYRRLIALCFLSGLVYFAFMTLHDVPMYLDRWREAEAGGRRYLPLWEGLRDVATRRVVTADIDQWREEMPWMSFYFTVSVWFSLALCSIPLQPATLRRALGPLDGSRALARDGECDRAALRQRQTAPNQHPPRPAPWSA